MTLTFNRKKEITDEMEYTIYHQFFLIPEENVYIHRVTIGTI